MLLHRLENHEAPNGRLASAHRDGSAAPWHDEAMTMRGTRIEFLVHADGAAARQTIALKRLVIAGWTGRDPVARDKHIAELEELGIARPATTPIYYEAAASRLTTADQIEVSGAESSGEVEFVLVKSGGRL